MARPKVIIIGGGFAGLNVAKNLTNTEFEVVLIDKTNHHLFQPLLYQVATAAISPAEIANPIREILRKASNITVLMGEVVSIDPKNNTLTLFNQEKMHFDYLVVATGARHSYFGKSEWEANAPGLKTLNDAIKIREHILISFEKAERLIEPQKINRYMTFVVIGAGPTGVEMAGAIAEITRTTLLKNFRRIHPETAHIYLLEATDYVLPFYPQKVSIKARNDLESLGVTVITGKKVTNITPEGVQLEDHFIESENIFWAAGNEAPSLLSTLGVPQDRQQRVIVERDLSIPGYSHIFVIGDSAHVVGKDNRPLPGIAPVAIQQGKYIAKLLKKALPQEERSSFSYFDKGSIATIGKFKAVAVLGKLSFTGLFAWFAWGFIHILYLIGFRNRFFVLTHWLILLISGERGVRLIYRLVDEEI